jgi:hypothetical protein
MFILKYLIQFLSSGNFSFVYLRENFMDDNLYQMKFLARDVNLLKSSIQNFDRQLNHQVVPCVKIDNAKILEIKNKGNFRGSVRIFRRPK